MIGIHIRIGQILIMQFQGGNYHLFGQIHYA